VTGRKEEPTEWEHLTGWWFEELHHDPAYDGLVLPLLLDLLDPQEGACYLDLGCGEGRIMASLPKRTTVVGCDVNRDLLAKAGGLVVEARLPDLRWVRDGAFDGAYVSLVVEHLDDEGALFRNLSGAVKAGGCLAIVINHPYLTAPESAPIEDSRDGEVLWRWGRYFDRGFTDEPAGRQKVRFHHRSFAQLLTSAADAGWWLRRLVELPASAEQLEALPMLAGQDGIPRLAGLRWTLAV
jgi:SAM-dependent methyltransferase